ncbi:MAG: Gfo/Idh/MocA family oxidoreductase [Candidatus Kapaibacteriales bacterium]
MKILKIGVIGVGHLGSIHARLLKRNDFAQLIGIYDVDDERALNLSKELDIPRALSLESLFEKTDAIIISSTTNTHYEIAKLALQYGKHCFIEKPITSNYLEAKELIEISQAKNLIIQVGHVERFNPALQTIMKYNPVPLFIESHRLSQFKNRATDVSVVFDLMIHDIDIILWLTKSKVKNIYANGVTVLTNTTDIANARIEFENGAVANLTSSRISAKPIRKMRIFQKKSYFSVDFASQKVEIYRLTEEKDFSDKTSLAFMLGNIDENTKNLSIIYETPEIKETNAIVEEQISFCRSILFGEKVQIPAEDATEAVRVAELIENQIQSKLNFL